MANTTPAKYTVQLGPTVTPEVAAELATWGELVGLSNSAVARECIEHGLVKLRKRWTAEVSKRMGWEHDYVQFENAYGESYDTHLEHFQGRGTRQTTRRRNYDRETRSTSSAA